jgi:hypothetical protein
MTPDPEFAMELRCPDCASPEVALIDRGTRLECGNCGAEFTREQSFVTVADAEAYAAARGCPDRSSAELFRFDLAKARTAIADPDGAIWPVNSFSDADELHSLLQAASECDVITCAERRAALYVYPLALTDPAPILAVDPGSGPTLVGHELAMRERDGEDPLEFTLRLLEETTEEANGLLNANAEGTAPRTAEPKA